MPKLWTAIFGSSVKLLLTYLSLLLILWLFINQYKSCFPPAKAASDLSAIAITVFGMDLGSKYAGVLLATVINLAGALTDSHSPHSFLPSRNPILWHGSSNYHNIWTIPIISLISFYLYVSTTSLQLSSEIHNSVFSTSIHNCYYSIQYALNTHTNVPDLTMHTNVPDITNVHKSTWSHNAHTSTWSHKCTQIYLISQCTQIYLISQCTQIYLISQCTQIYLISQCTHIYLISQVLLISVNFLYLM